MCTVCGCDTASMENAQHAHDHEHRAAHTHAHDHAHGHAPDHSLEHTQNHSHAHGSDGQTLDYGRGAAGVHVAGQSQERLVQIERDILGKNNDLAHQNRLRFNRLGITAVNLLSGPGSGKTTLLTETLKAMKDKLPLAVIEGDQQTSNDAARIRETGVEALQINTGKGCHLDADMVGHALDHLNAPEGGFLFIENVGNLVCPASFDLGEQARVVLASTTEGEDKPVKYPDMFASADLVLMTKKDLLPYLAFDVVAFEASVRQVNAMAPILAVSSTMQGGLRPWLAWLYDRLPLAARVAE